MARPGLDKHPKFRVLCRMLGEPRPHVRGYLDMLWDTVYENGDPVIGDPAAVEAVAEYPGETGRLFSALLSCGGEGKAGFIEPVPGHPERFQVHDLFDHAPDYVKKRHAREKERQTTADNGGQNPPTAENGRTPAPAPAPRKNPTGGAATPPDPPGGGCSQSDSPDRSTPSPPAREPPPRRPRKVKEPPTGAHVEFVRVFCDGWRSRYGEDYPFQGGKDGRHVKWCRDQLSDDVARWRSIVEAFLGDDGDFFAGHELGKLVSQFARFKAKSGPRPDADGCLPGRRATMAELHKIDPVMYPLDPDPEDKP
jgi:hypothetical protein